MNEQETQTPAPQPAPEPETPSAPPAGREDFARRFPDVNPEELAARPPFRRFCGSRLEREDMGQLYADYLAFAESMALEADRRAADRYERSTGGGGGRGTDGLNAEQQAALEAWNRSYPAMRMTAQEFLERK